MFKFYIKVYFEVSAKLNFIGINQRKTSVIDMIEITLVIIIYIHE